MISNTIFFISYCNENMPLTVSLEQSLAQNSAVDFRQWLSVSKPDTKEDNKSHIICFFAYEPDIEKLPARLLAGVMPPDSGMECRIMLSSASQLLIGNILSLLEFEPAPALPGQIFMSAEESRDVARQLEDLLYPPPFCPPNINHRQSYPQIPEEEAFSPLSQKNIHCLRPIGQISSLPNRREFQRDYERITHSTAYRRLVDKAQIFTASKGDRYRTRMTHTLEVAQIAKAIAVELRLNVSLTEAISLAHDLGHTPFGHQGERTLDQILTTLVPGNPNVYGGFKHNFQSLRVMQLLEEHYTAFEGLDISYQVLEGALKHTRCPGNYDLEQFFPNGDIQYLYPEYKHPTTLEGQVVAIADEIAQREHDLNDAIMANIIQISELEELLCLSGMENFKESLDGIRNELKHCHETHRKFTNEKELHALRISSEVTKYLIADMVRQSGKNMDQFQPDSFYNEHHRFRTPLMAFSSSGQRVCNYLGKCISRKVVNCPEVVNFDFLASKIVRQLFQVYYKNPKLLKKTTLQRIYIEMLKHCRNIIDLYNGDPKIVSKELEFIHNAFSESTILKEQDELADYQAKNKILVRGIIDYIASMTDSFAAAEYHRLM